MKKYDEIPQEIKMPVYWVMSNDNGDVDDVNGSPVFDLDEMANILTGRISDALGINVSIDILELEKSVHTETCPECNALCSAEKYDNASVRILCIKCEVLWDVKEDGTYNAEDNELYLKQMKGE